MLAAGAALAVACGGEEIVEVEKVVVQTVIVEKQVEKQVEKKVVETVIVEKQVEKLVIVTAEPAKVVAAEKAAPTPTPAAEAAPVAASGHVRVSTKDGTAHIQGLS